MSGGGKSASEVTVGYRYLMGVQIVPCHGPVDRLNRIIVGERLAWTGTVSNNATIYVNKPELFGGDSREGGVVGNVDVCMGAAGQARNAYLAKFQGAACTAYRGLFSLVFRKVQWSSGNPYFKAPWIDATRILKGWQNDTPWYPEAAVIGTKDMNPAHIIYQCFTDSSWGMGYTADDMSDTVFRAAADKLKAESFGLSLTWDQESTIEDFVGNILTHINGSVGLNLATGKFELRLIRDDYSIGSLLELNESNMIVRSFQRAALGDAANEVVVSYRDRDANEKTIAVQNLAAISAQGAVVSTTKSYPGIREASLAARVAMRDLTTLSTPLAQMTVVTNRVMWDKEKGDVVKVVWPALGINGVPFRVIDIDKGTLTDGKITVSLVEDVFGLPSSNYTANQPSQWVDTVVPPVAVDASKAVEAPYWEIVKKIKLADREQLQTGYGFGQMLAKRGAVQSTLNFILSASPDNTDYVDVTTGHFNPSGSLVSTVGKTDELVVLTGAYDLDNVVLSENGGYAYIDDECVSVISCDQDTGQVQIRRGILDTVPASHSIGAKMYFVSPGGTFDPTERVDGEEVFYKPRPSTGIGTLDLDEASAVPLTLSNRATRPYPPGNVQVNGEYYPVTIPGPGVTVTWAHRDRVAQTVDFNDYKTGNIGPEPGTTYRLRIWSGASLLHTYDLSGDTTSWQYPTDHDDADGNLAVLTITLHSVRDGVESLQGVQHQFMRSVTSGHPATIESPPVACVLTAVPGNFKNILTWVWGDLRTNIEKVELRVAEVPDFGKSTVLQYVDYPAQQYDHEIGTVRAFRWYWARVQDVNGQLSPWSNMVSARALASDPETTLAGINDLLTNGSGTHKIEMIADRFSIVAPDGSKTPFAVVEKSPGQWATLLNSDVLIGGNVDIANLNSGALRNDVVMRLGGGTIELDGAGEIRVFKSTDPNSDFVRLSSGEIRFLRYIAGVYQTYNYLSRIETGIANSGDAVTIPGYWKAQPRVFTSPAILSLYKKDYSNQDQAISCEAKNLREVVAGSGVWQFDAVATLNLAAASGGYAINVGSGATSVNTYTSPSQTTPANCLNITPTLTLKSNRGNGSSLYYKRTVKWRVEYFSGGSWVAGAWRYTSMGTQTGNVIDNMQFDFPSAGTWQWRVYCEAYDTDGTTFGSMQYTYYQNTVETTSFGPSNATPDNPLQDHTLTLPAHGLSGEIYRIDYAWSCITKGSFSSTGTNVYGYFYNYGLTTFGTGHAISYSYTYNPSTGAVTETPPNSWSGSFSVTGSNLTYDNTLHSRLRRDGGSSPAYASLAQNDVTGSATVYTRIPIPNSTTPDNNFNLTSYTYNLTSAQILATGSLNWQAIGE